MDRTCGRRVFYEVSLTIWLVAATVSTVRADQLPSAVTVDADNPIGDGLPQAAAVQTSFNNFDSEGGYNPTTAWGIGSLRPPRMSALGNAFTVPSGQNYSLSHIDLAIGYLFGTNTVTVSLETDVGGLPSGNVLESWTFNNLNSFGYETKFGADSTNGPLLAAGVQYWLIASVPAGTLVAWNWNNIGDKGPLAFGFNGEPFSVIDTRGAFDILGNPVAVPEPNSLLLFSSGLLGLGAAAYRYRNK